MESKRLVLWKRESEDLSDSRSSVVQCFTLTSVIALIRVASTSSVRLERNGKSSADSELSRRNSREKADERTSLRLGIFLLCAFWLKPLETLGIHSVGRRWEGIWICWIRYLRVGSKRRELLLQIYNCFRFILSLLRRWFPVYSRDRGGQSDYWNRMNYHATSNILLSFLLRRIKWQK